MRTPPEGCLEALAARVRAFAVERDWGQFHTPKNLVMALSAEVGELLENFQWLSAEEASAVMDRAGRATAVRSELADVFIYLVRLADVLGVDLLDAAGEKVAANAERYPVHLARGSAEKSTALRRTPSPPPPHEQQSNEARSASGGGNAEAVARFAFEMGVLKRVRRAGWWQAGIRDPESVAEHSLRAAQLAALLAAMEGADPARASYLGLWHDSQETRTGDIPLSGSPYLQSVPAEQITADQTAGLPVPASEAVRDAIAEYEAAETPEASCAKDADKLEMLLQAVEYRHAGYGQLQEWIDSARAALGTDAARRIADAAVHMSPLDWRDERISRETDE